MSSLLPRVQNTKKRVRDSGEVKYSTLDVMQPILNLKFRKRYPPFILPTLDNSHLDEDYLKLKH